MKRSTATTLWIAVIALSATGSADEVRLKNGGRLRGKVLEPTQGGKRILVQSHKGVRISLATDDVERVKKSTPQEDTYRRAAPKFADRVDHLWSLAEWCREHGLAERRNAHLQRIIQLDPNHLKARYALGFSQVKGRWLTREQHRKEQGLVHHNGRWRTAQEVELMESKRKMSLAERQWMTRLRQWRKDLGNEKASQTARKITRIRDHHAIRPLFKLASQEPRRPVKRLYIDALSGMHTEPALVALLQLSLRDPDDEVFYDCLEELLRYKRADMTLVYLNVLRSRNNWQVNRAAIALGRLGDKQAVSPLIDALMTTHYSVFQTSTKDSITSTFARNGDKGSGMSTGSNTIVIPRRVPNQAVLDALVALTNVSLGFDQRAWRFWYDAKQSSNSRSVAQSRRDE